MPPELIVGGFLLFLFGITVLLILACQKRDNDGVRIRAAKPKKHARVCDLCDSNDTVSEFIDYHGGGREEIIHCRYCGNISFIYHD